MPRLPRQTVSTVGNCVNVTSTSVTFKEKGKVIIGGVHFEILPKRKPITIVYDTLKDYKDGPYSVTLERNKIQVTKKEVESETESEEEEPEQIRDVNTVINVFGKNSIGLVESGSVVFM